MITEINNMEVAQLCSQILDEEINKNFKFDEEKYDVEKYINFASATLAPDPAFFNDEGCCFYPL